MAHAGMPPHETPIWNATSGLCLAAALALGIGAVVAFNDPLADEADRQASGASVGWLALAFGHVVGTLPAIAALASRKPSVAANLGLTSAVVFGVGGLAFFFVVGYRTILFVFWDLFAPGFALLWGCLIAHRALKDLATPLDRGLIRAGAFLWLAAYALFAWVSAASFLDSFFRDTTPPGDAWPATMFLGKLAVLLAAAALLAFPATTPRWRQAMQAARIASVFVAIAVLVLAPIEVFALWNVDNESAFVNRWTAHAFEGALRGLVVLGLWLPTFRAPRWTRATGLRNGLTAALAVLAALSASAWYTDEFLRPLALWHLGMGLTWAALHHALTLATPSPHVAAADAPTGPRAAPTVD